MKAIGLPCPDCGTRGMIRVAHMNYRCRNTECAGLYHLRYILAKLGAPKAETPKLTLLERNA